MDLEPMPMGVVAEQAIMMIDREITERPAKIVEKTIAQRTTIDNPSGKHREKREQIVTAALAKFFAQSRRPVNRLDLPTVRVQIFQRLAGERARVGNERFHHGIPVTLEGAGIQHVERVSLPAIAGGRNA